MDEITLKSFIASFEKGRKALVELELNTSFLKVRTRLSLNKEIRRMDIIIQAGERFLRHQVHQD